MARSQSAIMSVPDRKAARSEKASLKLQLKEAKAESRTAERAAKAAAKEVDKVQAQIDRVDAKLAKDKERRAAA